MAADPSNADVARRYAEACVRSDQASMTSLRHAAWAAHWPQSGEVVRGDAAYRAISDAYPGGRPTVLDLERIVGEDDRWVVTAGNTILRVSGSGDHWWGEWHMRYPDGATYHCVALLELRDGLVWRETVYWAEPFDAPAWRAGLVERAERVARA